jgi:hypothetical protein
MLCCAAPPPLQDVSLKLLLDAARGLAYMHDVDVVHGDVKSRNLLVFWEEDDEDQQQQQQQQEGEEGGVQGQQGAAGDAAAGDASGSQQQQEQQLQRSSSPRPPVWGLKWCDFGVSFRAAEAPNGILKTVSAVLVCGGCLSVVVSACSGWRVRALALLGVVWGCCRGKSL